MSLPETSIVAPPSLRPAQPFITVAPALDPGDAHRAARLLEEVGNTYRDVQSTALLEAAPLIAQDLPRPWRMFLHAARVREERGVFVVPALDAIGPPRHPTPRDWHEVQSPSPTHNAEILLVLLSSLLGDVFGWSTQQDGRYVHDVLPMKGLENEQVGWSSLTPLTWHTEDAFHEHRADYLALLCIRNPGAIATTFWSVNNLDLNAEEWAVLWERRFLIRPDNSHLPRYNTGSPQRFEKILAMMSSPSRVAVLFGNRERPYLRIDPDYMTAVPGDVQAEEALAALSRVIESNLVDLALREGDICFLDNFQVVHGRRPFRAHYDGSDRWLKRVNIMRDLRRAASSRNLPTRLLG